MRVVSEAKSNLYTQSSNGNYKLFVNDGTSTASGENHAPLPISYMKYYDTFATKPSGGAWTWTNIDNLKIGAVCSSPSISVPEDYAFRPDANGRAIAFLHSGDAANYLCVDEAVADEDTTYIYNTADVTTDYYSIPNHGTFSGTINNVSIYFRARTNGAAKKFHVIPKVYTYATVYNGDTYNVYGATYYNYSNSWTVNPNTLAAWTWAEIDALEIGLGATFYEGGSGQINITQIYCVVNFTRPNTNPEIRTTQCYALVNYSPATSTVSLNLPETLSDSHSRQIERITFPSGNYAVDDYGRQGKTLSISGQEVTNAFAKMQTLKDMCHYGKNVTIAGLPDGNLNTDYMIVNFNFNQEPGEMNRYHWTLELEEV